jgi:hypothetical protein
MNKKLLALAPALFVIALACAKEPSATQSTGRICRLAGSGISGTAYQTALAESKVHANHGQP